MLILIVLVSGLTYLLVLLALAAILVRSKIREMDAARIVKQRLYELRNPQRPSDWTGTYDD